MDQSINALVAVTRRLQELSRVLTELWRRRKTTRWRCARPFGRVGQRMHRAFGGMNGIGHKTSRTQLRIGQQIFGAVHRHVGHIGGIEQRLPLLRGAGEKLERDFGGDARAVFDTALDEAERVADGVFASAEDVDEASEGRDAVPSEVVSGDRVEGHPAVC